MDLSKFIPTTDTTTFEIKHPITGDVLVDDKGKAMTLTVYLPHAAQYKAVVHEQTNKRIAKAQKGSKTPYTSEEMEAATLDLIVKTTKDWHVQLDGKTPKFTEQACRDVYDKLPWIRAQIIEAQESFQDFFMS